MLVVQRKRIAFALRSFEPLIFELKKNYEISIEENIATKEPDNENQKTLLD